MKRLECREQGCTTPRAVKGLNKNGTTMYRVVCEWHRSRYHRMTAEQIFKKKARRKLQDAVAAGIIDRQDCDVCSSKETEAHHPDHKEALIVIWLCKKHHLILHGLAK